MVDKMSKGINIKKDEVNEKIQKIAIEVRDVKKKFRVYFDKSYSLKERILFKQRNHHEDRWVLQGISFDVKVGEAVGIIGVNGCGKSTLLKLLTRILYPDEGTVRVYGRVSSLIELGAGFHPDMSGRENIYTNAAIFGLTKDEIDKKLEDIIAFSEIEDFIDNPVRTYSSGMYMRLAFSVAIHVNADVLLIDEILAVGDAGFQAKCFNKLREVKAKGTTIVIVSHSLGQIEQICDRSIWINAGKIQEMGEPRDVQMEYLNFVGEKQNQAEKLETIDEVEEKLEMNRETKQSDGDKINNSSKAKVENRWGNGDVKITDVFLRDLAGTNNKHHKTGDYFEVEIQYNAFKKIVNPNIGVQFFRIDNIDCYGVNTAIDNIKNIVLEGKGFIKFRVDPNNLLPGEYKIDIAIESHDGFAYDYIKGYSTFVMYSSIQDIGVSRLVHSWEIK